MSRRQCLLAALESEDPRLVKFLDERCRSAFSFAYVKVSSHWLTFTTAVYLCGFLDALQLDERRTK